MYCVDCGRDSQVTEIHILPKAMSPDIGICVNCEDRLSRRGVKEGIQRESDRLLSTQHFKLFGSELLPPPYCKFCGEKMIVDARGFAKMWCWECEAYRRQLAARGKS